MRWCVMTLGAAIALVSACGGGGGDLEAACKNVVDKAKAAGARDKDLLDLERCRVSFGPKSPVAKRCKNYGDVLACIAKAPTIVDVYQACGKKCDKHPCEEDGSGKCMGWP